VKEASGNLGQITDILKDRPPTLSVLSGDDEMTLAVMGAGGDGVISVVSNATPKKMAQLCEAAAKKDWDRARQLHFELLRWVRAAFIESNPLPVKAAMAMLGKMQNNLRLPLVPLDEKHADTVREALRTAGSL
jgi:4-hydroxy-tetrahydrodipicolinate synthase